MKSSKSKEKIAVIGLGYVGLPLLSELSKKFHVIGFDISRSRVDALNQAINKAKSFGLDNFCTDNFGIFIISVPTPTIFV